MIFFNKKFWIPQSFFNRTLWLILLVVLFSKLLTLIYLIANEDILVDRQYSHGIAVIVKSYWAVDKKSQSEILKKSGLLWKANNNENNEIIWPYGMIFQRQMELELGKDIRTKLNVNSPTILWINAPKYGYGWLGVPSNGLISISRFSSP